MQHIPKKRFGYKAPWKLADALKWRLRHGGTLDNAESELAAMCGNEIIEATGLVAGSHPERKEEPLWWQPFIHPASSHRLGTPRHAVLRASNWADLRVVRDADGQPTSDLEFKDYLSPAWQAVELEDRYAAMKAWRAAIDRQRSHEMETIGAQTGAPGRPPKGIYLCVAEFNRRAENNSCEAKVRDEAAYLESWFHRQYPQKNPVKAKSIENQIRAPHREWKSGYSPHKIA